MSQPPPTTSNLQELFESALKEYEERAGTKLLEHELAIKLKSCDSANSVIEVLQTEAQKFHKFRGDDGKVMKWLKRTVHFLHTLSTSGLAGQGVGLSFPPAQAIFAGIGVLLNAIKDVSASYDALIDLFEFMESFLRRLDIYTNIPPTPAMTEILLKILIELLSTLALGTKQVKQGRLKKLGKKLFGENDLELVLQRFDRLTQEEARTTAAQTLDVAYHIVKSMKEVMDDGKAQENDIRKALVILQQIASDMNKTTRDQMQKTSRQWLSPPDPSTNHNILWKAHHDGTATWFIHGNLFPDWRAKGSLLWIHGNPGSGKSVLCSAIIQYIKDRREAGLASLAYFYCDFRDTAKKGVRGLLTSLLVQLSARSDRCCEILSALYSKHDGGSQQPSDDALTQCLKDMLTIPRQGPIYIIVDAIDECPNKSGTPSPRESVLHLLNELIQLHDPDLHIGVTSRPEPDIETILLPLSSHRVSLQDESGQNLDIANYIIAMVNSDQKMRKWSAENKQLVIDTLSRKADGMFRWVFCQLDTLRRCLPGRILRTLEELPGTLDGTYEQALESIEEENWEYARRLFQCITVASRPLHVEELAEFLAIDLDVDQKAVPTFVEEWRPEDPRAAILYTCSSLITVVEDPWARTRIVQFSHFSVREFLTSSRLSVTRQPVSRYYIALEPAHTIVAQGCLGLLLQLAADSRVSKRWSLSWPLADYAARHWVSHAQFEDVSSHVRDAMESLFDPNKQYFSIWVSLWNADSSWYKYKGRRSAAFPKSTATPLYYAALCGFRETVEWLVIRRQQDVHTRGGRRATPLHAATTQGHLKVAQFLLEHGAIVNRKGSFDQTPLHAAAKEGHLEIATLLLEHGANVNAKNARQRTPLLRAAKRGHLGVTRTLLLHGADVRARDEDGQTALHHAAMKGHLELVTLLLAHGANANALNNEQQTPLLCVLPRRHLEAIRVLLLHGADIQARDKDGQTPIHLASSHGDLEMATLLLEHGVNANATAAQNTIQETPLHCASQRGFLEVMRMLLRHRADIRFRDKDGQTALFVVVGINHPVAATLLLEHGADANAQNLQQVTPLHRAAWTGCLEVTRVLLCHGANVQARNSDGETPLLLATWKGHLEITALLLSHGADANSQTTQQVTPLHCAAWKGFSELAALLLAHSANVNALDNEQQTPLLCVVPRGHLEAARVLLLHGADIQAQDKDGQTTIHLASRYGHLEMATLLLEHGVNANAQNTMQETPLHCASQGAFPEVMRLLLRHRADIRLRNKDGQTALFFVVGTDNPVAATLLLEQGADANTQNSQQVTPLHRAAWEGCLEVTHVLLRHSADVQARNRNGETPLLLATWKGHLEISALLLKHGADTNAQTTQQVTPLHCAAWRGYSGVMRLLLRHTTDVQARDKNGQTPLHLAASGGYSEVATQLLAHGADANTRNVKQQTPLFCAVLGGDLDTTRLLLRNGANIQARDRSGKTALHLAAIKGHSEIAVLLLAYGADVNSQNTNQQTPLWCAARRGNLGMIRVLLRSGADVHVQDNAGQTPLHCAVLKGDMEVTRLLFRRGADIQARDNDGQTALLLAERRGHLEMVMLLLRCSADENACDSQDQGTFPVLI